MARAGLGEAQQVGHLAQCRALVGDAHQLPNPTDESVVHLEVGDRSPGDNVTYPDDDLKATLVEGRWVFTHKGGSPD